MKTPDWFVRVWRAARDLPDAPMARLDGMTEPVYRPAGWWCFTRPGLGRPLLYSFPQPLHPLEAVAAAVGFGGWDHGIDSIRALAARRFWPWVEYTAALSDYLALTPQRARLSYHWFSPLNVAGHVPDWLPRPSGEGPVRHNWEGETDERNHDRAGPQSP